MLRADPLEMDDGKELIEMVCMGYESPDDPAEDDQHDFSECLAFGVPRRTPAFLMEAQQLGLTNGFPSSRQSLLTVLLFVLFDLL